MYLLWSCTVYACFLVGHTRTNIIYLAGECPILAIYSTNPIWHRVLLEGNCKMREELSENATVWKKKYSRYIFSIFFLCKEIGCTDLMLWSICVGYIWWKVERLIRLFCCKVMVEIKMCLKMWFPLCLPFEWQPSGWRFLHGCEAF